MAKKEGRSDDAVRYFENSLAQKRDNASAWFELGTLYLERGKLDEAENALRKSLALDPNGIQTEYNVGGQLYGLGVELPKVQKRMAQRYGVSLRTIQRAWQQRAKWKSARI